MIQQNHRPKLLIGLEARVPHPTAPTPTLWEVTTGEGKGSWVGPTLFQPSLRQRSKQLSPLTLMLLLYHRVSVFQSGGTMDCEFVGWASGAHAYSSSVFSGFCCIYVVFILNAVNRTCNVQFIATTAARAIQRIFLVLFYRKSCIVRNFVRNL